MRNNGADPEALAGEVPAALEVLQDKGKRGGK